MKRRKSPLPRLQRTTARPISSWRDSSLAIKPRWARLTYAAPGLVVSAGIDAFGHGPGLAGEAVRPLARPDLGRFAHLQSAPPRHDAAVLQDRQLSNPAAV